MTALHVTFFIIFFGGIFSYSHVNAMNSEGRSELLKERQKANRKRLRYENELYNNTEQIKQIQPSIDFLNTQVSQETNSNTVNNYIKHLLIVADNTTLVESIKAIKPAENTTVIYDLLGNQKNDPAMLQTTQSEFQKACQTLSEINPSFTIITEEMEKQRKELYGEVHIEAFDPEPLTQPKAEELTIIENQVKKHENHDLKQTFDGQKIILRDFENAKKMVLKKRDMCQQSKNDTQISLEKSNECDKNLAINEIQSLIDQFNNTPLNLDTNEKNIKKEDFDKLREKMSHFSNSANHDLHSNYNNMLNNKIESVTSVLHDVFIKSETLQPIEKLQIITEQLNIFGNQDLKKTLKALQLEYLDTCKHIIASSVFITNTSDPRKNITKNEEIYFSKILLDNVCGEIKNYTLTEKDKKWLETLAYIIFIHNANPNDQNIRNAIKSIDPRNNFDNFYKYNVDLFNNKMKSIKEGRLDNVNPLFSIILEDGEPWTIDKALQYLSSVSNNKLTTNESLATPLPNQNLRLLVTYFYAMKFLFNELETNLTDEIIEKIKNLREPSDLSILEKNIVISSSESPLNLLFYSNLKEYRLSRLQRKIILPSSQPQLGNNNQISSTPQQQNLEKSKPNSKTTSSHTIKKPDKLTNTQKIIATVSVGALLLCCYSYFTKGHVYSFINSFLYQRLLHMFFW